jgi:hypothetical protein
MLVYVTPAVFAAVATVDCARTPATLVRHLPKPVWLPVIIGLYVLGPLCWLVVGRRAGPPPRRVRRPDGTLPPDDDPEFLRLIDEEIQRRAR